ncbi:hypothetical protein IKE67_09120 [bacterium]|nr:hypothetical protein [bacterium]
MIITETVTINDKKFKHTYSDSGFYIQKEDTEEKYAEAYDVIDSDYTYIETEEKIPMDEENALKLTRGDVFRGIFQAKGIKREQIRALIQAMAETTEEEKIAKELASIDFDEALYFYRQNPLIDKIGKQLGISSYQMTKFFETNDWQELNKE